MVLAIGAVVLAVILAVMSGGKSMGVPADFPQYPGAKIIGIRTFVGAGVGDYPSGQTTNVTYSIPTDSSTVTAYYDEHLTGGPWSITGHDASCGCINFAHTGGTQGELQVLGTGTSSRLEVQFHK